MDADGGIQMEEFRWRNSDGERNPFFRLQYLCYVEMRVGELEVVSLKNPCPFFTAMAILGRRLHW